MSKTYHNKIADIASATEITNWIVSYFEDKHPDLPKQLKDKLTLYFVYAGLTWKQSDIDIIIIIIILIDIQEGYTQHGLKEKARPHLESLLQVFSGIVRRKKEKKDQ